MNGRPVCFQEGGTRLPGGWWAARGGVPAGCRGLLITLEYPQQEKAGPPFSVIEDEVRALFDGAWRVKPLERRDILEQQPNFQAERVTALQTAAYRLERR